PDPLPQITGDRLLDGQEGLHFEQVVDLQAMQVVAEVDEGGYLAGEPVKAAPCCCHAAGPGRRRRRSERTAAGRGGPGHDYGSFLVVVSGVVGRLGVHRPVRLGSSSWAGQFLGATAVYFRMAHGQYQPDALGGVRRRNPRWRFGLVWPPSLWER